MDYALLPPEINSVRMYTGPGASSMLAAATSWDSLAAELGTTAEIYESVVSSLNALHWSGPAAAAMTTAVTPYLGWLYMTAEQTRQTAMQARAAVAAYEQAYAMTVPPPLIAANRAQLTALIATNFFGQNTSAIAATEAQYAEMWAQDAGAMFGYAASSAAATTLTPFASPAETTNPEGLSAQSAAVAQANSNATAASVIDWISQLISQLANSYNQWTAGLESWAQGIREIVIAEGNPDALDLLNYLNDGVSAVTLPISAFTALISVMAQSAGSGAPAAFDFSGLTPVLAEGLTNPLLGAMGASSRVITGAVGEAGFIGPLSVPASWAAPSTHTVAALSPAGLTAFSGGEEAAGAGMPGVPGMPAGTLARGSGVLPRYGVRLTVMAHPPAAG